jgi:trafficking protein particle complex subunit 4
MAPVASDEDTVIEEMTTDTFTLRNFRTATGFTFFVTASLGTKHLDEFLKGVYQIFADYVLKNPFYTMDQTINKEISSLFSHHIGILVKSHQHYGY